jgi:hypothetical protein
MQTEPFSQNYEEDLLIILENLNFSLFEFESNNNVGDAEVKNFIDENLKEILMDSESLDNDTKDYIYYDVYLDKFLSQTNSEIHKCLPYYILQLTGIKQN